MNKIPVLTDKSKWKDVVAYLQWLAKSQYEYHIDDDPADPGFGFPKDVVEALSANDEIFWSFANDKMGSNLWDVYTKALEDAGKLPGGENDWFTVNC